MSTRPSAPQISDKKVNEDGDLLKDILEHASTITHVLLISLCTFIIWLCCKNTFTLLTWHVFLYTIGWILLMTEGTLFLLKENIISKRLRQPVKVTLHWIIQFLAVGVSVSGFVVIIVNKAGVNHFVSDHAISGLVATILAILACLNGLVVLFNVELRHWITPNHNKLLHGIFGFATVVSGAYATITGYHTNWFRRRVDNEDVVILCFVVTVIIVVWSLLRPVLNCFNRIKNMFT